MPLRHNGAPGKEPQAIGRWPDSNPEGVYVQTAYIVRQAISYVNLFGTRALT